MSRVLVVDDETELAELLAHQLGRAGFEVCCADAVESAQAAGKEGRFDVLVTDLNLPDGDGVELARSLEIPICLALTGAEAETSRVLGAGFAAVLVKPVSGARLVEAIQQAIAAAGS